MQMNEEHFWTETFKNLAENHIATTENALDFGTCLLDDPKFYGRGGAIVKTVLEEGNGTKISDVCMMVFEKFLNNTLLTNPRVEARELANDIEEALTELRRDDLATDLLPKLVKVRFVEVQISQLISPPPPRTDTQTPQEGSQ